MLFELFTTNYIKSIAYDQICIGFSFKLISIIYKVKISSLIILYSIYSTINLYEDHVK